MRQSAFVRAWIGVLSMGVLVGSTRAQTTVSTATTDPTTNTTTNSANSSTSTTTAPTTLPAEAIKLRGQIDGAYGELKSLAMSGTISADIDIAGQQNKQSQSFKASYAAPGKYRHAIGDEFLLGSTGQKLYTYDSKAKTYLQGDAPAKRGALSQFSIPIPRILEMQNPSLLLAIADNTLDDLLEGAKDVRVASKQKIGDTLCEELTFIASDGRAITLFFDAQTHLLRQARYDLSQVFIERGAPEVKAAVVTIDYTDQEPRLGVEDAQFAWAPPEGAREQPMARPMPETSALEGQPAPDFKLKGLDGKEVQLASLKNQVVVLDFWATWCPPCVKSLPDLNKLYEQRKAKGLQVFAVNLREELTAVKAFITEKKLTMPVLLDADGAVGEAYSAHAPPQTVIIGKDGKVKKVFVGLPPGGAAEIARAVDAAMNSK